MQQAHLDKGEDARVLLNGVTCTVSVPASSSSSSSSSNLLRSRCMTSSSYQFLPLFSVFSRSLLMSATATYFPFIRSLSRCILFLPLVAFPLILPSIILCSNDSCLNTCLNHTFHLFFVELPHFVHPTNFLHPSPNPHFHGF